MPPCRVPSVGTLIRTLSRRPCSSGEHTRFRERGHVFPYGGAGGSRTCIGLVPHFTITVTYRTKVPSPGWDCR